jgi:hypothetical protein
MPKFFGLFSNNGLTVFLASATLDLSGGAATLLLPFFTFLTGFLAPGLLVGGFSNKIISFVQYESN